MLNKKNNITIPKAFFMTFFIVFIVAVIIFIISRPMISTNEELSDIAEIVKIETKSVLENNVENLTVKEQKKKKFWDGRIEGRTIFKEDSQGLLIVEWFMIDDAVKIKTIKQENTNKIIYLNHEFFSPEKDSGAD